MKTGKAVQKLGYVYQQEFAVYFTQVESNEWIQKMFLFRGKKKVFFPVSYSGMQDQRALVCWLWPDLGPTEATLRYKRQRQAIPRQFDCRIISYNTVKKRTMCTIPYNQMLHGHICPILTWCTYKKKRMISCRSEEVFSNHKHKLKIKGMGYFQAPFCGAKNSKWVEKEIARI